MQLNIFNKINMKKAISNIYKGAAILTFVVFSTILMAQGPPPPPPGGVGSGDHNTQGGSAPIGGGSLILIGLAAIYGGKKVYDFKQNAEKLEE